MFKKRNSKGCYTLNFYTADDMETFIISFESMDELYNYIYPGKPQDKYVYNKLTAIISQAVNSQSHVTRVIDGKAMKVYKVYSSKRKCKGESFIQID